jgi:hypothetical protein
MYRRIAPLILLLMATPAAAQLRSLGVFWDWGTFARSDPKNCYAITQPQPSQRSRDRQPFVSIAYWPGRGVRGQVHFKLSRNKRPGSAVLLRIDDRTFQLVAGEGDAWAPDAQGDALIVAAMRSGVEMVVQTRGANGALVRDSYRLRGAATAIDAAAVACAR